mgnify:CR=1 FL=1
MARYDITPEGAEALRNLGRDLLKCTNDMLEQDQMLKRKIHSLENDLGIYSDEIVDKNVQGLKSGRDDIVRLAELLNKQADEVLLLCSL